ncbi:MAG TPA: twin-arginine translocase subunit TatC [Phycisphaerales bacterium]|nr:twin-arginine translocase subunit TatC [Phycisphaerales bacterium]
MPPNRNPDNPRDVADDTHVAVMTLGQHLDDLRRRMIFALIGLVPILVVCLWRGEWLLDHLILQPTREILNDANQGGLTTIDPTEVFSAYIRVSMIAAIVAGAPWILYQLWLFVAPGLHKHERRFVYLLIPLSTILGAAGVYFLFKVVLPLILSFLITFGTSLGAREIPTVERPVDVVIPKLPILQGDLKDAQTGEMWLNEPLRQVRIAVTDAEGKTVVLGMPAFAQAGVSTQYTVNNVVSLMLTLILAFAAAFQAPVIILLLGWAGLINRSFLHKYRRHAIVVNAIIAAALMPGDVVSMLSMMAPLLILYELGGILLWIFPASRVAGRKRETTEDEDDRP